MIDPTIQYEFFRQCDRVIENNTLSLIVRNLSRGISYKTKTRIEESGVKLSPTKAMSALVTWGLQHRKEKTGNLTLLLMDLLRTPSAMKPWKEEFKQKEEELNQILSDLALPQTKLDKNYEKNYFDVRDILSRSETFLPPESETSTDP